MGTLYSLGVPTGLIGRFLILLHYDQISDNNPFTIIFLAPNDSETKTSINQAISAISASLLTPHTIGFPLLYLLIKLNQ